MKIFEENYELLYPGGAGAWQSFKYKKHLLDIRSDYQKIDVFETEYGKVLVLDGIVQTTELDEFIYHEMLTHVPMFTHQSPKRVLIVGGGDGGTLREVLKHPKSENDEFSVMMIEIDREVRYASEKFLGADFSDPRLEIVEEDAAVTLKNLACTFDVCIIDCTDPGTSGGKSLYTRDFMASLIKRMSHGGVISMMSGVPMAQGLNHVRGINEFMKFMGWEPYCYTTTVPSYYGGLTAMMLYTNNSHRNKMLAVPDMELKNYNAKIHEAAFVLPNWLKEMLNG